MGKYLDKFKRGSKKVDENINRWANRPKKSNKNYIGDFGHDEYLDKDIEDRGFDEDFENDSNYWDEVGPITSQKPESFHHYILENQYRDLERSIRGFKDVWDKNEQKYITIRKREHCFTDEEAEEILRTAQSHLATDIKLSFVSKESFPLLMDAIYQELAFLFESIAEYRYGRYGDYEKQYEMKLQNHKIFLELFTRVQANYSRAIQGMENKMTHDSVKGQESLQNTERFEDRNRRYS